MSQIKYLQAKGDREKSVGYTPTFPAKAGIGANLPTYLPTGGVY